MSYYKYKARYAYGITIVEIVPTVLPLSTDFRDMIKFADTHFQLNKMNGVKVHKDSINFESKYKDNKDLAKGFMKEYRDSYLN